MEFDQHGNNVLLMGEGEGEEDEESYDQIKRKLWASPAPGEGATPPNPRGGVTFLYVVWACPRPTEVLLAGGRASPLPSCTQLPEPSVARVRDRPIARDCSLLVTRRGGRHSSFTPKSILFGSIRLSILMLPTGESYHIRTAPHCRLFQPNRWVICSAPGGTAQLMERGCIV